MRSGLTFALLLLATPLAGQSVRGRILDPDGGPIPGAIVILADSAGAERGRMLSSPIGSYLLRAPGPGRYALQVLRIGYPAFRGPAFEVPASGLVEVNATLPEDPIVLADLSVSAEDQTCHADESVAGATAQLLEEVQKAVGAADLALHDRDLRFEVVWKVERSGLHVEAAADSVVQVMRSWPVHSLPPEQFRDHGFVQHADSVDAAYVPVGSEGRVWFGPDPTTLFAAPFLATHCYRIVTDGHDADRVGLRFSPVPGRRLADIRGTLWLRRRTLGLETIEYEYVNLPRHLTRGTAERARGAMALLRLPGGLWIVSRWSLKAPVEMVRNNIPTGVAGWLEQGGAIKSIRTVQGTVIY